MEPGLVNGLPAHVLMVHAIVVLVPLTALALVSCAVWPTMMRRAGVALPALALVTLGLLPLTLESGEWLEERVTENPLVEAHTALGESLLPWAVGLFVVAAALWLVRRRATAGPDDGARTFADRVPVRIVAVLLSLAVAAGASVQVYRIGDSGAKATWQGGFSTTAVDGGEDEDE